MEKNLTTGSVFGNIVRFSLPYLFSYFLQTLYGMADRAGVDFIAAGWTHTVPHIIETMQRISPHYCRTVAELTALLLDETEA